MSWPLRRELVLDSPRSGPRPAFVFAAIAFAVVLARLPLLAVTHRLPVSNDDAVLLLMGRYILKGELATILWNQPYNGALDAYLLAPLLALFSHHAAFRLYERICAVLLVAAVALAARRVARGARPAGRPDADDPAAFGPAEDAGRAALLCGVVLAGVGTPYMALMTATGPPPNFLVPLLVSFPLLLGLRSLQGDRVSGRAALLAGLVAGLGIWNTSLTIPSLGGVAVGLLAAGWRPGRRGTSFFAAGLAAGVIPLLVARSSGASGAHAVTAVRPVWLWMDGLGDLARAVIGLAGFQVPLVVDGPERASLPIILTLLLAPGLGALVLYGCASRAALPLLGWAFGIAGAFAFSRRTGADEVRYLYGLTVPILALASAGLGRLWPRRKAQAIALAGAVLVPWLAGQWILVRVWRDPGHAVRVWQVPPIEPVLDTLRRAGIRSAYASVQFATRLTLESGQSVIASQAWNERIPGDPLRFRDEVDLDGRVAWVLSPHLSRGMPRAAGFRELLKSLGGSWREDLPGDFVVFRRFVPPYDEARPVQEPLVSVATLDGTLVRGPVLDRNIATAWTSPVGITRGTGVVVRLRLPRRLSAVVFGVDLERSPLAVPWVCEVDRQVVARGPARYGLQWINGAPRAGKQALLVIPLADRLVSELRLLFQGAGPPLVLNEVFVYGPDEPARPVVGANAASAALERARAGEWDEAAGLYSDAVRLEPHRASYHACLARARWRAERRSWLDVEGLDDGGPELVGAR